MQVEGFTLVDMNGDEYELVAQCTIQTLDGGEPFATIDTMQFAGEAIDRNGLVLLLGATEADVAIERCKDSAEDRMWRDTHEARDEVDSYDADNERKRLQEEEWR